MPRPDGPDAASVPPVVVVVRRHMGMAVGAVVIVIALVVVALLAGREDATPDPAEPASPLNVSPAPTSLDEPEETALEERAPASTVSPSAHGSGTAKPPPAVVRPKAQTPGKNEGDPVGPPPPESIRVY